MVSVVSVSNRLLVVSQRSLSIEKKTPDQQSTRIPVRKPIRDDSRRDDDKKIATITGLRSREHHQRHSLEEQQYSQNGKRKNLDDLLKSRREEKSKYDEKRSVNQNRSTCSRPERIVADQATRPVTSRHSTKERIDEIHRGIGEAQLLHPDLSLRE